MFILPTSINARKFLFSIPKQFAVYASRAGSQNDIDFPHRYVLTLEGRRGSILDVKNDRRQLEGLNFTSHKTAERWFWPGNDLPLYQVKLCH